MNKMLSLFTFALIFLSTQPAQANIEVGFVESAPKDRFIIKNTGECILENVMVAIDLTQSTGRLIFDTTASGAGVDVFQPFEIKEGDIELVSLEGVKDGDTELSLIVKSLPSGKSVSFTIDVDDTMLKSELGKTRVSGSEIENGLVKISIRKEKPVIGVFGSDSKAIALLPPCLSP